MLNSELYVIVKLVSGEQLMATLVAEDEVYIEIQSPMCIRTIPVLAEHKEHITAHPLCQFSDDTHFVLDKKNVLFIKKMHQMFVPHYKRIVAEHEETVLVTPQKDGSVKRAEDLDWDDLETVEDVRKKIDMLQSILGQEPEKEEEERFRNFVEGNDTIN